METNITRIYKIGFNIKMNILCRETKRGKRKKQEHSQEKEINKKGRNVG